MNFRKLVESVLLLEVTISKANKERFMKKYDTDENKAVDYINKFNSVIVKLTNKDIFGYNDLKELDRALKQAQETKTKRQVVKETAIAGSTKVYEDNNCVVRLIRTKEAAIAYGKGAPWCISYDDRVPAEDERSGNLFWNYSISQNKTIYILTAKRPIYDISSEVNANSEEGKAGRSADQFMAFLGASNVEWKKLAILVEYDPKRSGVMEVWDYLNEKIYNSQVPEDFRAKYNKPNPFKLFPDVFDRIKHVPFTEKELLPHIETDTRVALEYAYFVKKRVPKVEEILLKNGISFEALEYTTFIVRGRWTEFEKLILNTVSEFLKSPFYFSSSVVRNYVLNTIGDRWLEFEALLSGKQLPRKLQDLYDEYKSVNRIREPSKKRKK
jgi:hypothetical protein